MRQHCTCSFLGQCWLRQIQTKLWIIFLWKFVCAMLAKPDQEKILQVNRPRKDECVLWANTAQVIFMWNVISDIFRQHWMDDIPMQCQEPLEQHCTGFLPIKCCPIGIKTTLNSIFSYAILPGASRAALHKVSPVQCCSRR